MSVGGCSSFSKAAPPSPEEEQYLATLQGGRGGAAGAGLAAGAAGAGSAAGADGAGTGGAASGAVPGAAPGALSAGAPGAPSAGGGRRVRGLDHVEIELDAAQIVALAGGRAGGRFQIFLAWRRLGGDLAGIVDQPVQVVRRVRVGQRIFERILRVASGERSKSEQYDVGSNEFAPWPIGATV